MLIFLKILLVLFCLLLGLILLILFTPIVLSFTNNSEKTGGSSILIHFFHPVITRISYIFSSNKYEIVIFNFFKFGNLKDKVGPDLSEKIIVPDGEQSTSESVYPGPEHDVTEHNSEKYDPEPDSGGESQSEFNAEDQHKKDYPQHIDSNTTDSSSPETLRPETPDSENPDIVEEQEGFDSKKDISSNDTSPKNSFLKTLKRKILAFKDMSQFILDQKKIAKNVFLWLIRIAKTIVKVIRFDDLSLYVKAGFDDPCLTGIVYGYVTGIKNILELNNYSSNGVSFEPLFNKSDHVTIDGSIRIKTSLAWMCRPVVVAIFTFPYISAFILWRRMKKWKKVIKKDHQF